MGKVLSIEFDETSLRKFYRRIDPAHLIKNPMDSFYLRVAGTMQKKTSAYAPVDTGKLSRSVKIEKRRSMGGGLSGVAVVVRSPYGLFVNEGTRPHFPPVSALTGWASRHGMNPYAVAVGISKRGTRAQPFFDKALKETAHALPIELRKAAVSIEHKWGV